MALKDLLALADDKLHDVFHLKPSDPVKDRKPHLKWLDKRKAAWSDIGNKRDRFIKVSNNIVEFKLPFELNGRSTFYVASEHFAKFLNGLHIAVSEGEADEAIAALNKGARTPGAAPAEKPVQKRAGWSPERKAAFAAKKAQKK